MTRRKTDGERVANATEWHDLVGKHYLAERIDRLVRRRMAEAWDEGNVSPGYLRDNPYRGRKNK
jgi:hypothetical protein